LTGEVGLFRMPLDAVVRTAQPWRRPTTVRHGSLDDALAAHAPYKFAIRDAAFALSAGRGEWTVALESSFPNTGIIGFMRARAELDLRCEFVAVQWIPRNTRVLPGAAFLHYRPAQRRLPFGRRTADQRWVSVSDQGGRWDFHAVGAVRDFEEPEQYQARRKADRLNVALLGRYLASLGIATDDPEWLDGPTAVTRRGHTLEADATWSTVEELRKLCGYPADRIPTDLVRL
jgi:hypothetical protein